MADDKHIISIFVKLFDQASANSKRAVDGIKNVQKAGDNLDKSQEKNHKSQKVRDAEQIASIGRTSKAFASSLREIEDTGKRARAAREADEKLDRSFRERRSQTAAAKARDDSRARATERQTEARANEAWGKSILRQTEELQRQLNFTIRKGIDERMREADAARKADLVSHRATETAKTAATVTNEQKRRQASQTRGVGDRERLRTEGHAARVDKAIDYVRTSTQIREEARRRVAAERDEIRVQKQVQKEYERSGTILNRFRTQKRLLGKESDGLTRKLARVGLAVRGLAVAGAITFARSLISAMVALAAQAVALAGSLTMAAGVLGGAFVAGLAQAIPMVALLGGAMSRLSVIQEAVNQNDLLQKQQFGDTGDAESAAAANDAIADAQRGVKEAQEALTDARSDAKRELRDLILAEKEAALASRRSALSQQESRRSLSERIKSGEGSLLDLSSDQLSVKESGLDRRRSKNDLGDTRQDLQKARKQGLDSVTDATKALADAQRNLARAHKSAAEGASSQVAAERNLNYFLSELTGTERKLYERFVSFREKFQKTMTPITDILFRSVLKGMDKVEKAIFSPKIVGAFTKLSKQMGKSLEGITDVFTSKRSVNFWEDMIGEGSKNLPLIEKIVGKIYRIFMDIAESAGPALRHVLEFIDDTFKSIEETTSDKKGMAKFFEDGIKHFDAWMDLIGAILSLFGALTGASGDSAITTLEDLTSRLEKATDWLHNNREEAKKFFDDTSKSVGYLMDIITNLGEAMVALHRPESLETLAEILDDVLIPALEDGIWAVSIMIAIVDKLLELPLVKNFLKWAVAGRIVYGSFGLLSSVIASLFAPLRRLWLVVMPGVWSAFLGTKIGEKFAAKAAGLILDMNKFGRKAKDLMLRAGARAAAMFAAAFEGLTAAGGKLTKAFNKMSRRMKIMGGLLGAALVAGMIFFMSDENARESLLNAGLDFAAWIGDGLISGMKIVISQLNSLIKGSMDMIPDFIKDKLGIGDIEIPDIKISFKEKLDEFRDNRKIEQEYRDQMDRQQRRGGASNDTWGGSNARGATKLPRYTVPKSSDRNPIGNFSQFKSNDKEIRKESEAFKNNTTAKKENARASKEQGNNNRNAAKEIVNSKNKQEAQKGMIKGTNGLIAILNNKIKDGAKEQKAFAKATVGATKKGDEQKEGARKLGKKLFGLTKTLRGTGEKSRGLGQMIGDVTNKVLKSFGVKELKFSLPSLGSVMGSIGNLVGLETGGYLGSKHERGPDDRTIAVAGGEAVLTGFHQREANRAFAVANAVGESPYANLDQMFRNDSRLHRSAPRGFERGGYTGVTGDTDFSPTLGRKLEQLVAATGTPIYVQSGGRTMAEQAALYAKYLNGTGNLAAAPSPTAPHIRGIAADITPGAEVFGSAASRFGLGFTVPGESWHISLLDGASAAPGMAGGSFGPAPKLKKIKIDGPDGPLKNQLLGQEKELREGANKYIAMKMPAASDGSSGAPTVLPGGPGRIVGASMYGGPTDPISGTIGYRGDSLPGKMAFAELGYTGGGAETANLLGGLPRGAKARITYNGKSVIGEKLDIGAGGGDVQGHPRAVDLWYETANALGFGTGVGLVKFDPLERGGFVPEFDNGGIVPGPRGMPRIIKAHGGETVLPTHKRFNGGGTPGNKSTQKDKKSWEPKTPKRFRNGPLEGLGDLGAAFVGLSKAYTINFKAEKSKFKKSVKNFEDRLQKFYDGIAEANSGMEKLVLRQTRKTAEWAYKVVNGMASQTKTSEQISKRELKNLSDQGEYLAEQDKMLNKTEKDLRKQLKKTPKKNKELREKIRHAINKLENSSDELGDRMVENMQARLEAQQTVFDNRISKFSVKRSMLDTRIAIQEALGEGQMGEDDEVNPNNSNIKNLINKDTDTLRNERKFLNKSLRKARRDGDKGQIDMLTQALLDNKLAIIENNTRIKDLDKTTGDNTDATKENTELSFRTSAWQNFRFAVLDAMGGINPQLKTSIPKLHTGADYVSKGGLFELETGEAVINKTGVRNGGNQENNIYITERTQVADPTILSNTIAFKLKQLQSV